MKKITLDYIKQVLPNAIKNEAQKRGPEIVANELLNSNFKSIADEVFHQFLMYQKLVKLAKQHEKELKATKLAKDDTKQKIEQDIKDNIDFLNYFDELANENILAEQKVEQIFEETKRFLQDKLSKEAEKTCPLRKISCEYDYLKKANPYLNPVIYADDSNYIISKQTISNNLDNLKNEIIDAFEADRQTPEDIEQKQKAKNELAVLNLKKEKLERKENISVGMKMLF